MSDDLKLAVRREEIKARGYSIDGLVDALASAEIHIAELHELVSNLIEEHEKSLMTTQEGVLRVIDETQVKVEQKAEDFHNVALEYAQETFGFGKPVGVREFKSAKGRSMADSRHDKPGAAREKHQRALDCWATGEYRTKVECAQKCHEKISVSYETMKDKYLRNAPNPSPWPAREKGKS